MNMHYWCAMSIPMSVPLSSEAIVSLHSLLKSHYVSHCRGDRCFIIKQAAFEVVRIDLSTRNLNNPVCVKERRATRINS